MPRTSFGKTRPADTPYATYASRDGWVWKVLKTYKHSSAEDPYSKVRRCDITHDAPRMRWVIPIAAMLSLTVSWSMRIKSGAMSIASDVPRYRNNQMVPWSSDHGAR